jgi:hypothetical protein
MPPPRDNRWLRRAMCAIALTASLAPPAQAFVRTTTSIGSPMFWNRTIMNITAYTGEPPAGLTAEDIVRAARGAADVWGRGSLDCTSLELRVSAAPEASGPAQLDGISRMSFRREEWCKEPRGQADPCYDPFALAVTSVFARKVDGEILDADVELNAVTFEWSDLNSHPDLRNSNQDLQNTLTHEFGHFIGLDHTCTLSVSRVGQTDDKGQPVPSCSRASDPVRETTMFAAVIPGDMDRRTLAPDDQRAVCTVYPALDTDLQGDNRGCTSSVAGRRPGRAGLGFALVAAIALALRRRRAPPSPASRSSTDRARRR